MITLKLKLKDQEIDLTLFEAKQLYDELQALFNKKDNVLPWTYPYTPPFLYRVDAKGTSCRG